MNAQQALTQALTPAPAPVHAPGGGNPLSSARPAPNAPNSAMPHCETIPAAPGGAAPGAPASAPPQIPAGLGPMAAMALAAAAAQSGGGASWTAGQASAAGLRGIVAGEALRGLQAACAEGAAEQGPTNSLCSLVRLRPGAGRPFRKAPGSLGRR